MKSIAVENLYEIWRNRDDENVLFLDMRNEDEYEELRLEGAELLPLPQLEFSEMDFSGLDYVFVFCFSGGRSARAVRFLSQKFPEVNFVNVEGGLRAWRDAGFDLIYA